MNDLSEVESRKLCRMEVAVTASIGNAVVTSRAEVVSTMNDRFNILEESLRVCGEQTLGSLRKMTSAPSEA